MKILALDTIKSRKNKNRKRYLENSPQKRMIWAARKRAKERGLPFNITEDDIVIPNVCPYLGIELTTSADKYGTRHTVCSLDRIVPELGYVKGNIEVISHQANTMKQAASKEELILFAKHILEKFSENTSSGYRNDDEQQGEPL